MSEHMKEYLIGVDIGGSHISSALISSETGELLSSDVHRDHLSTSGSAATIIEQWSKNIRKAVGDRAAKSIKAIGIAMPGPFDYENGISLIKGLHKYENLYNLNVRDLLKATLSPLSAEIFFENDAACFGLGESLDSSLLPTEKIIAITLGTGFGATFIHNRKILKEGIGVPPDGAIYHVPYLDGITEDRVSARWLLAAYNTRSGKRISEVSEIALRAKEHKDGDAIAVFDEFGQHLGRCLSPWIREFAAGALVIGGSIAKSADLFMNSFRQELETAGALLPVQISKHMEKSALRGAAAIALQRSTTK